MNLRNNKRIWLLFLPMVVLMTGCTKNVPLASSGSAESESWPAMPEPGPVPLFEVPESTSFTLSNGVPVTLLQAGTIPMVQMQVNIFSGSASDPEGKSGVASLAGAMLKEGTELHSALELSELLLDMSSGIGVGAQLEYSSASVRCLEDKFSDTVALLAEIIRSPTFNSEDVERIREQRRSSLLAEKDRLPSIGYKVFRRLVFGDHYAGRPGRGTLASVERITRDDLIDWHARAWIVLVGRLPAEVVKSVLEEHLGAWDATSFSNAMALDPVPVAERKPQAPPYEQEQRRGTTVYWVDRPGAAQSYVTVGQSAPSWDEKLQASRVLGNSALGGQFTSRLNMNLREGVPSGTRDKHPAYTYGAGSSISSYSQGGMFRARASVKTAVTAASLQEFMYEISGILEDRPIDEQEFKAGQDRSLQGFPSRFEGIRGLLGQFASVDAMRRPDGWLAGYRERVAGVSREQAQQQLNEILDPTQLVVVIVGDFAAVGQEVAALDLGPIVMLDDEGDELPASVEEAGD